MGALSGGWLEVLCGKRCLRGRVSLGALFSGEIRPVRDFLETWMGFSDGEMSKGKNVSWGTLSWGDLS